ncbi:hypothetical protein B0J11DRAFT_66573 [Dendryphion nanum]|uniref:Uncharacterized protein n=1 Tax=Dendryphion nanum TaxID=256645 RepID=A0A9P9DIN6_9PLEO|nr:hypothetical protein B0J11DRAFT_66573 [Dendryphion nanum]
MHGKGMMWREEKFLRHHKMLQEREESCNCGTEKSAWYGMEWYPKVDTPTCQGKKIISALYLGPALACLLACLSADAEKVLSREMLMANQNRLTCEENNKPIIYGEISPPLPSTNTNTNIVPLPVRCVALTCAYLALQGPARLLQNHRDYPPRCDIIPAENNRRNRGLTLWQCTPPSSLRTEKKHHQEVERPREEKSQASHPIGPLALKSRKRYKTTNRE